MVNTVQTLSKSVYNCQSYWQKFRGTFFMAHCVQCFLVHIGADTTNLNAFEHWTKLSINWNRLVWYRVEFLPECQYWIQFSRPDFSVELGCTCVGTFEYLQLSDDAAASHPLWRPVNVLRQTKVRWWVCFRQHLNGVNEVLQWINTEINQPTITYLQRSKKRNTNSTTEQIKQKIKSK